MPDIEKILNDLVTESPTEDQNFHEENDALQPLLSCIETISNTHVQNFVRTVLLNAPMTFWTAPADVEEGLHPSDEYVTGGMVVHTRRVVRAAQILSECYGLDDEEYDMVIAAALLHDITKMVHVTDTEWYEMDPFHAFTVGNYIAKVREQNKIHGDESKSSVMYLSEDISSQILRLIRVQNGLNSPIPEVLPVTTTDMVLHLADVMACTAEQILNETI